MEQEVEQESSTHAKLKWVSVGFSPRSRLQLHFKQWPGRIFDHGDYGLLYSRKDEWPLTSGSANWVLFTETRNSQDGYLSGIYMVQYNCSFLCVCVRLAVTPSVNREADKISVGRYEISTTVRGRAAPPEPSFNLISLTLNSSFSPKHFVRWLSFCIAPAVYLGLYQQLHLPVTHLSTQWLPCRGYTILLSLIAGIWGGLCGHYTPVLHCLPQTFIKGPAGKWERTTTSGYLIHKCVCVYCRKREREREKQEHDVMFVYLTIGLFALTSQWTSRCLLYTLCDVSVKREEQD